MIKTKKLFKNISGIFNKKTDSQTLTSRSIFDSKISNINLILNSSETVQEPIIPGPAIPVSKTELPVHIEPEPPVHTEPEHPVPVKSKPSTHHSFKPPVSLNTEPLIHTKPEPPVHTLPKQPIVRQDAAVSPKTNPSITPKTEPPLNTQTEQFVPKCTNPYKKGMQEINKLKFQLEQMEISRKASSKKYKIIT